MNFYQKKQHILLDIYNNPNSVFIKYITADEEETPFALEYEGFIARSYDEDIGAVDEPLLAP